MLLQKFVPIAEIAVQREGITPERPEKSVGKEGVMEASKIMETAFELGMCKDENP